MDIHIPDFSRPETINYGSLFDAYRLVGEEIQGRGLDHLSQDINAYLAEVNRKFVDTPVPTINFEVNIKLTNSINDDGLLLDFIIEPLGISILEMTRTSVGVVTVNVNTEVKNLLDDVLQPKIKLLQGTIRTQGRQEIALTDIAAEYTSKIDEIKQDIIETKDQYGSRLLKYPVAWYVKYKTHMIDILQRDLKEVIRETDKVANDKSTNQDTIDFFLYLSNFMIYLVEEPGIDNIINIIRRFFLDTKDRYKVIYDPEEAVTYAEAETRLESNLYDILILLESDGR